MVKLYEDKALYNELAQNATQMAKRLNWESESEKMLEIYKQVNGKNIHNEIEEYTLDEH